MSYGYEENPDVKISDIIHTTGDIKESFLEANRTAEIERLAEWLTNLEPNKDLKWIINLVNKADLWWDKADDVNEYYEKGDYKIAFNSINAISQYTSVLTIPYCSIIKPYFDISTSGRFGENHKQGLHNNLINTLFGLLENNC